MKNWARLIVTLGSLFAVASCAAIAGLPDDYQLAADAIDGGADGGSPGVATPGRVACGAGSCLLATEYCCFASGGPSCIPFGTTCDGVRGTCDDKADCKDSEVCCISKVQPSGVEARCQSECNTNEPKACRTEAECSNGCSSWTCAGTDLSTCGGAGASNGCL